MVIIWANEFDTLQIDKRGLKWIDVQATKCYCNQLVVMSRCCLFVAMFKLSSTEHILKYGPIAVLAMSTFHCLWVMTCYIYLISFFYTLGYQHELNGSEKWFAKM